MAYHSYAARMDGMMDLIGPMRTFVRVVEAGSFTAVATEQRTTQPTISRQVAALEDHLGTRLLTRTTRALTLTDDGQSFYEHAVRVLETLSEAEGAVGRRRNKPAGTLRLATPVVFGRLHIVPRMAAFLQRYPDVLVDVVMSDTFTDLIEQGIDLAIRVGEISDPSLVARRIGVVRRVTVASPAYLKANGTPRTPHDLANHQCIVYTRLTTGNRWMFDSPQGAVTIETSGRFRADNSEAVREAVLAGLGIAVIPAFAFTGEITSGRVKVLLKAFEPKRLPLHAVHPSRRFVPLKVRAMIDHLAHELRIDPALSDYGFTSRDD
jgi:DNA-binding transcriptional LysR family regulator